MDEANLEIFKISSEEDLSSLRFKLNEQERINKFLRGEVNELRGEINQIYSKKLLRISNYLGKNFFIRAFRKINRILKAAYFGRHFKNKINFQVPKETVDIVIPVFKKFDLLRNLLASLDLVKYSNIRKVIIVEDSGIPGAATGIEMIIDSLNLDRNRFLINANAENMGFGKSVNQAWQATTSDFVVLINTDIELPPNWLERLLNPFRDELVALATPLATNSGANLTINLQNKLNWRDFDLKLMRHKPSFPPACTAIGYCLAIRKSSIQTSYLFSDEFLHGYGEDSDLHFEVLDSGFKSVVVDNLLVWHYSSASYSTLVRVEDFKDSNVKKFHEKWGRKYQEDLLNWNKSKPLNKIKNLSTNLSKRKDVEFLFIQLSNNAEIGGIAQLESVYEEFSLRQHDVGIFYLNHDPSIYNDGSKLIFSASELEKIKAKKIIFSGLESFSTLKRYSNLSISNKINFLQGPDYLFPGNESRLADFKESLTSVNHVISQSKYLENIANFFGSPDTKTVTLGPKQAVFYDTGIKKEKVLAIPTRKDSDKGLRFMLPVLKKLNDSGWLTVGFGDLPHPSLAKLFSRHLGRISSEQVARELQKAAALIDLSIYEGLGLSALEAGLCGSQPIVSRKGGINSLDEFSSALVLIDDPLNLDEIYLKIMGLDLSSIEKNRKFLAEQARRYSWESSIDLFIQNVISY